MTTGVMFNLVGPNRSGSSIADRGVDVPAAQKCIHASGMNFHGLVQNRSHNGRADAVNTFGTPPMNCTFRDAGTVKVESKMTEFGIHQDGLIVSANDLNALGRGNFVEGTV